MEMFITLGLTVLLSVLDIVIAIKLYKKDDCIPIDIIYLFVFKPVQVSEKSDKPRHISVLLQLILTELQKDSKSKRGIPGSKSKIYLLDIITFDENNILSDYLEHNLFAWYYEPRNFKKDIKWLKKHINKTRIRREHYLKNTFSKYFKK